MTTLLYDLRFALRQMRRSPGFALTAVLTLALGIAANVIVFGVLQAMILRPLDVPRPNRVKTLQATNQGFPMFAYPEVRDIRDQNTVFSAVAADGIQDFGLEANGVTRPVWGYEVSGQYFEVMAVKPLLGRLLNRADDDHPGASDAAVLSFPAWKSYFNGDPGVVGKTVRINRHPYTVIGVTPQGFYGTERFLQPDIFVPMQNEASLEGVSWLEQRHDKNVFAIVRLKDGVTVPQAEAELKLIAARIVRQDPKDEDGIGFKLVRPGLLGDALGRPVNGFLAGVMGLAAIVLLAACANLGSLFAARTADRGREIAIRMAIGSSRWRVVRQVLVEAFVVAVLGGACACALSWSALTALAAWHPPTSYPIRFAVLPRPSLALAAFFISICAGALCGVVPLRQILSTDPNDAIKGGGALSAGLPLGKRGWALRDFLLAAQIALCCVTVTAAFVSLRGLVAAMNVDLGFQPGHAVLTAFDLSHSGYSIEASGHIQRRLLEKVRQIPGVKAASYADCTPFDSLSVTDIYAQGTTDFRPPNKAFDTFYANVSPGYFNAAGTPLLAGRDLTLADDVAAPAVAVVNREFARRLFPFKDDGGLGGAVGRYFKNSSGAPVRIVGIVTDGKYETLSENQQAMVFYPILQHGNTATALIVRLAPGASAAAEAEMADTIRKAVHDLDPSIPIRESGAWTGALSLMFLPAQAATVALSVFGAFGLLLSIAGTFGLASYTVSQRLRELSIRVALGAQGKQVLKAALGRMLVLLAGGSLAGVLLGIAAGRVLSAIVYHGSAQDPLVLGAVALTILLTGSLSVARPVWRALHIDPANLLREQ